MYSQTVQPTPPAGTDVGRCWKFATDGDRPLSTPHLKLQNRGPRVRILPPLPCFLAVLVFRIATFWPASRRCSAPSSTFVYSQETFEDVC